jgi:hypothetical protein
MAARAGNGKPASVHGFTRDIDPCLLARMPVEAELHNKLIFHRRDKLKIVQHNKLKITQHKKLMNARRNKLMDA